MSDPALSTGLPSEQIHIVSTKESKLSRSENLVAIGIVLSILGCSAMLGSMLSFPQVSTGFWIATAATGSGLMLTTQALISYKNNVKKLERFHELPHQTTIEKDLNAHNHYAVEISNILNYHDRTDHRLLSQNTESDIRRNNIYLLNGQPISFGDDFKNEIQKITMDCEVTNKILQLVQSGLVA